VNTLVLAWIPTTVMGQQLEALFLKDRECYNHKLNSGFCTIVRRVRLYPARGSRMWTLCSGFGLAKHMLIDTHCLPEMTQWMEEHLDSDA
jgi:hypothetical protein